MCWDIPKRVTILVLSKFTKLALLSQMDEREAYQEKEA